LKQQEQLKVKHEYKKLQQKFIKSLEGETSLSKGDEIDYKRLERILEAHRCPMCFKLIPDEEEYVTESYIGLQSRWHPKCLEERDKRVSFARKRREELNQFFRKIKEEIEANKRRGTWTVFWTVTGYKRDYERLMEDLPNILKQYGLEPWKKVKKSSF